MSMIRTTGIQPYTNHCQPKTKTRIWNTQKCRKLFYISFLRQLIWLNIYAVALAQLCVGHLALCMFHSLLCSSPNITYLVRCAEGGCGWGRDNLMGQTRTHERANQVGSSFPMTVLGCYSQGLKLVGALCQIHGICFIVIVTDGKAKQT